SPPPTTRRRRRARQRPPSRPSRPARPRSSTRGRTQSSAPAAAAAWCARGPATRAATAAPTPAARSPCARAAGERCRAQCLAESEGPPLRPFRFQVTATEPVASAAAGTSASCEATPRARRVAPPPLLFPLGLGLRRGRLRLDRVFPRDDGRDRALCPALAEAGDEAEHEQGQPPVVVLTCSARTASATSSLRAARRTGRATCARPARAG